MHQLSITKPQVAAVIVVTLILTWMLSYVPDYIYDSSNNNEALRAAHASGDAAPAETEQQEAKAPSGQFGPPRTPFERGLYTDVQVEILHAKPSAREPRAAILVFHGCNHKGSDWFTLPEEGIIVRKALEKGFAVLAVTSYDRLSGCWNEVDLERLPPAIQEFKEKQSWFKDLPLFSIGASSGASFASTVPTAIPVRGIYAQIGRPNFGVLERWIKPHPVAIHLLWMPNDEQLKVALEFYFRKLKEEGIQLKVSSLLKSTPCAITEERLSKRIYDMDPELASTIVKELVKRKIIHHETKMPLDPTIRGLQSKIPSDEIFYAVQEEIQVCYARHELTAEHIDVVLKDWASLVKNKA